MTQKAGRIVASTVMDMAMTEKFDWHSEIIEPDTLIDAGYKNTQNARRFFKKQIGEGFKFDRSFMAWMKINTGRTMADAVLEYQKRKSEK